MDGQRIGQGPIQHVRLLTGGTQNILMRFCRDGRDYVLRHPPANPRTTSNRVIAREIELLGGLTGSKVPHPALIAGCTDVSVLGAVFYLMEPVDGFNPTVALSAPAADDAAVRHRMGLELMDGLAALGDIDPVAVNLQNFGKLEGFLDRQTGRWASELAGFSQFAGWEGPAALGNVEAVGHWLDDNKPSSMKAGIIHGDFHIGNMIYADDGTLLAIVDWEMATLGDPLVDLSRVLISWPDAGVRMPYTMRVDRLDGFPSRAEMVRRYADRSGRDLSALPWFEVLACYKLGILFEGTHARAQAGLADKATGDRLHGAAVALLDNARRIIARA
nr:phosphotransferase family protein [Niveispirillum sp. SYP-B3756]